MTYLPITLALKDLRHDWQAAVCFIAALVGVLAPLLIVLALKNGVIGTMVGRLVEDPSNREILAVGAGRYDQDFFNALAARGDVEFAMPATRSINASADAVQNMANRQLERAVPLVPSAAGDPLITAFAPVGPGKVYVSAALSEALGGLRAGAMLEILIGREIDGREELARRELEVLGLVPDDMYGRDALFLSLPDLLAIERFRDDAAITPATWMKDRPAPEAYASFRLYAKELDQLKGLRGWLEDQGITTRLRAQNAALLLAFRDNLNVLYTGVAILAVAGFWASMAANLRGAVERQRIAFSLLRLLGLSRRGRILIPVCQGLILVMAGIFLTFCLVVPATLIINSMFSASTGNAIATLGAQDLIATCGVGLLTAFTASGWAVWAVKGIEKAEVLRHG